MSGRSRWKVKWVGAGQISGPAFLYRLQGDFLVVRNPRKSRLAAITKATLVDGEGKWTEHLSIHLKWLAAA
jgi:hypothetical protein